MTMRLVSQCARRGAVAMETVAIISGEIDTIVGGKVVTVVVLAGYDSK